MESAAALIGSQSCDVLIAFLVYRQGQVTIGLALVNGGWHFMWRLLFFLSVGGRGEEGRVRTIRSYL